MSFSSSTPMIGQSKKRKNGHQLHEFWSNCYFWLFKSPPSLPKGNSLLLLWFYTIHSNLFICAVLLCILIVSLIKGIRSNDQDGFSGELGEFSCTFTFIFLFFPCISFFFSFSDNDNDNDNYSDKYYYLDSSENATDTIMPNSTSPQDNILITATGWSEFNGGNSTDMPLDMVFNDGHRLSIAVYRYYTYATKPNQTNIINLIANRLCCCCCYCYCWGYTGHTMEFNFAMNINHKRHSCFRKPFTKKKNKQ